MPALLWLTCGSLAAVVAGMRVQLLLLARSPQAGWWVTGAGALAAGLALAVVLATVFTCRSLRRTAVLFAALPVLLLGLGLTAAWRCPAARMKTPELAAEWGKLHPTLRLALRLAMLEDRQLVVTDVERDRQAYVDMGLAAPAASRHYAGPDAYVRGVDLRVADAGPLRNWARQGLLLIMGVDARRHVGTADHLHVTLPG